MDQASLIARIDGLLKASPPPPDKLLEKIAATLERARSGGADPDDGGLTSSVRSSASVASSAVTSSSRPRTPAAAPAASSALLKTDDDPLGFMSLQLKGMGDTKQQAYLERHAARAIRPPANIREQKTRQYQALLAGSGGKYIHADYVNNGATQIGGMTSMTPSLTAKDPISLAAASKLAAAGPPRIRNLPSDFKTA